MTTAGNLAFLHTEVTREERGWFGHFVESHRCLFRRNTLLTRGDIRLVVSTVGCYRQEDGTIRKIGHEHYYETEVYYADPKDAPFYGINVERPVDIRGKSTINDPCAHDRANSMHEAIVREMTAWLRRGGGRP